MTFFIFAFAQRLPCLQAQPLQLAFSEPSTMREPSLTIMLPNSALGPILFLIVTRLMTTLA